MLEQQQCKFLFNRNGFQRGDNEVFLSFFYQVCGCIYGQTERRGRVIFEISQCLSLKLSQSSKIYVQPQGIQTEVSEKFCWAEFLRSSGVSSEHVDELRVFLLVCGLRRVKDPLYLVEVFSEWHRENPLNVLVMIGPRIDPVFTVEVEAVAKKTAGVFLAQERSQRELHAAMKRCFTVVNSSVSEGMSAAILEAMDLGVPVLARDIPGNAAVVHHEFTGLLYSSPQMFPQVLGLGSKRAAFRDEAKIPHYYVVMQHTAACRKVQSEELPWELFSLIYNEV
ncbi:glycosyltransferase 1 domain-containing protein 1 isoform X3 [Cebidichthys violaceus]|uniref:glycosyltransferase 1 domain-containing protein 1 isoform X3 n=1 Tax=Cebidichthys violaceus TaxID=271503 RepID=UPI0035CA50C5